MRYLPLALIAGLQVAVLWKMAALEHRAVQIEAALEFMDYGKPAATACIAPVCAGGCNGALLGMLDLP